MTVPGKLEVDPDTGHVTGPASIAYNRPFPTPNGSWGSGVMSGVVMHTEAGNNPGTQAWFDNPAAHASATFAVGQDGTVIQFGPVGKGWYAWAQAAGNRQWYSVEHADDGNPANPLTPAQITASAQLLEVLSRFAGFPLQITDDPAAGRGLITHGDGGAAWGGHVNCPGDVRKAQRPQIIALAMAIRSGAQPAPAAREWVTAGQLSLSRLAAQERTQPSAILAATAQHTPGLPPEVAALVNGVFGGITDPSKPMPAGLRLYIPG